MVAVTLRIMPQTIDVDLAKVKKDIEAIVALSRGIKLQSAKEVPVAFGLKMLEVLLTMEDSHGGTDAIEKAISAVSGVASVEAGDVSLI
ncbi:MAG TPA: elongation factor 1-beta [Methylophilaceae bacterium]|nr:elongation factor 1-beta [Methylophilaceae bacterium]